MCVCVCVCACSVALSGPSLCDPIDYSPPNFYVHGIFQARSWSRLQFPMPGDFPDLGIEPASLVFPALAGRFFTTVTPGKPKEIISGVKSHFDKGATVVLRLLSERPLG